MIRYCKYGSRTMEHISHDDLLAEAREHRMLFARAEQSGCEGTYVEVARWSNERKRSERYCFEKFLDPIGEDVSAEASAIRIAAEINEASDGPLVKFIAALPDENETLTLAAMDLLVACKSAVIALTLRDASICQAANECRAAIAKAESSAAE